MDNPTREEKNRVIAEFIEPHPTFALTNHNWWISSGGGWESRTYSERRDEIKPVDFYGSEEASSLALEKMPEPQLTYRAGRGWECSFDWRFFHNGDDEAYPDRKTAIANAAYAYAMREKEQE